MTTNGDSAAQVTSYRGKRILDVFVASAALVVTAPLWPLIAAAIRLETKGPVLHRAERVGLFGQPFTLLKFRSMRTGFTGPAVTSGSDIRITRSGRILRMSKLDELPQFVNVLRGEMSIVGPRPEDPRYVVHYTVAQSAVLSVRPGITGAAAVAYRHEESILAKADDVEAAYVTDVLPAKLDLELSYVRTCSLSNDLALIARTILAITGRFH